MLKVLDVFPIGNMLSITLEGDCKEIRNGSKLLDPNGNTIIIDSVAVTRPIEPDSPDESTVVLVQMCNIQKGYELSIA